MGEVDLPPHGVRNAALRREADPPSPTSKVFLYAAGGGFIGALLAIVVAKILAGPCCCPDDGHRDTAAAATVSEIVFRSDRTLFA